MPRKVAKKPDEDNDEVTVDVRYNPDVVNGLLEELAVHVDNRCQLIQADTEFMVTSIKQAFSIELVRLPTSLKQMSLSRFREEYGESLEAFMSAYRLNGPAASSNNNNNNNNNSKKQTASSQAPQSAVKSTRGNAASKTVYQTPSHGRHANNISVTDTAAKSMRAPKEGERIVSANGSPLGEFQTVVKAKPTNNNFNIPVPPTPGVFVPLQTGEILDLGNVDVEKLPDTIKEDALEKMHIMMQNMQSLMSKLENPKKK